MLNNQLVSYWKLEAASGTRVDSKGSNNLSPNTSEITNATMKLNNGVYLTSAANSATFISCAASGLTGIGSALTISGWMIQAAYPTAKISMLELNGPWAIMQSATSGTLVLTWQTGGENISVNITSGIGTLFHFAVTREVSGLVRFFENGLQKGSGTASATILGTTGTLDMGDVGPGVGIGQKAEMKLDEMGLWSRVLTPNEVFQLYNNGNGNFFDHNNAGAFDFDALPLYTNTMTGICVASGTGSGTALKVNI